MTVLEAQLESFLRPLKQDLFKFSDAMGVDPTPQQAELYKLVMAGEPRIAVKSGKGTGKTAATNVIGAWRNIKHVDSLTYVTAPTMRQCRDVWLTEFSRMMDKVRYPILRTIFKVTKTRVIVGGRDKWGIRFLTATKEEAAQGIHENHLTFILEEMSGIEREFCRQVQGTMTHADPLTIGVGNPNTRDCEFFDLFNSQRNNWACLTFDSRKSPLTSKAQIQHIIDTYGEDSDVFRVQVAGEFPNMDPNCIISIDDLERCLVTDKYLAMRQPRSDRPGSKPAKQFGIDFARFGGDENVIVRRSGNCMMELKFFPHTEPKHVIKHAFRMQMEAGWENEETLYCADANGLGDGVMVDFYDADKSIDEFKATHKAGSLEFDGKITEAWFHFARKVRTGTVRLLNDRILLQQLSTRQYFITPKGKIRIESKDDYMKRGNASPDRADACVMAYYDESEAKAQ